MNITQSTLCYRKEYWNFYYSKSDNLFRWLCFKISKIHLYSGI